MKRSYRIIVLLLACLLLTGCGSAESEKKFAEFSSGLRSGGELRFTAELRAEYPDRTVKCTLAYAGKADECSMTVVEPEILAGVVLRCRDGKLCLESGSYCIDTGVPDTDGIPPVSALPLLVKAFSTGHLDSCANGEGEYIWQLIPSDGIGVNVWVQRDTLTPTHAEIVQGNRTVLFCDLREWTLGE